MPTYHINRSKHLTGIMDDAGWTPAHPTDIADFGMWYEPGDDTHRARVEFFNTQVSRILDNKLTMYQCLESCGFGDVTPPVFTTLADYMVYLKSTDSPVFCFLKVTNSTMGEGTDCFTDLKRLIDRIQTLDADRGAIIQQGIRHPWLVDGRKAKWRTMVLLDHQWNGYIHRDTLLIPHLAQYDPDSTADDVQLSPNYSPDVRLASDLEIWESVYRQMSTIAAKALHSLRYAPKDFKMTGDYLLFGFDFLCDHQGRVFLVEINAYSVIDRNDPIGEPACKRMLSDFYNLLIAPKCLGTEPKAGGFDLLPEIPVPTERG